MLAADWRKQEHRVTGISHEQKRQAKKKRYLLTSKSPGHIEEEERSKDAAGPIPRACNRPKQNILLTVFSVIIARVKISFCFIFTSCREANRL